MYSRMCESRTHSSTNPTLKRKGVWKRKRTCRNFETLIEGIRIASRNARLFRTLATKRRDPSLRTQWNEFCKEAEALQEKITSLGGVISGSQPIRTDPEQKS
jgi:hypothetical protein